MPDDDGQEPPDDGNERPDETILHFPKRRKRQKFKPNELTIGVLLREDEELAGLFRLDTFSGATMLTRPVPRPDVKPPKKFEPRDTTDVDITHLIEWLTANGATKTVSASMVDRAVQAEGVRNSFSSARDVLDRLPAWDGVFRLGKFWIDVCGARVVEEGMDDLEIHKRRRYLEATARCFFIGVVARICRPGCKLDTMPILEGPQGGLKSSLLRVLAFDRDEWFSDSMVNDLGNKDARQHLRGKLLIELAEMSQLKVTRMESMKAFLSARDDKYRPSYGRRDVMYPRQCVFIGTTNHDDYLVDMTGNRRFWPIQCGEIDLAKAGQQRDQLYAEAIASLFRGEQWWLPADVEPFAEIETRERLTDDPWEDGAIEAITFEKRRARAEERPWCWVTTTNVLEAIKVKREDWNKAMQMRAAALLVKLGGKRGKLPRGEGWPKRGFRFDFDP